MDLNRLPRLFFPVLFMLLFQRPVSAVHRQAVVFSQQNYLADSVGYAKQSWNASELFFQSQSRQLMLADDAIELTGEVLIEDDAAGIGSIRGEAWDTIGDGITLRKHLILPDSPVRNAIISMLLYPVGNTPLSGGKLVFTVNGNEPIVYEFNHFWTSVPVPVAYLKKGENRIEVAVQETGDRYRVPVALYEKFKYGPTANVSFPFRSARSIDSGNTWNNHVTAAGKTGEYPIRLKLQSYQDRAQLYTPVINLADKLLGEVVFSPATIHDAVIRIDTAETKGSRWLTRIRSGDTHQPALGGWTDWEELATEKLPAEHKKRFIQLEFSFEGNSGAETPKLNGLTVDSRWTVGLVTDNLTVVRSHNGAFTPSAFAFRHEDPANNKLQKFRKTFTLDSVVEGAKTEWEKMIRLRGWVAGQWDWFLPDPESPDLITWDATEILAGTGGKRGGNCLHYAVVFAHACQSFGIPARIVNTNFSIWGGHEVVEVWSNEFNKWVMIDPNFDTSFCDRKTGIPLNVLELHRIFLSTYYPEGEPVNRDQWSVDDRNLRTANIHPEQLPIAIEVGGHAFSGKIDDDYVWWKVAPNSLNAGYSGGYGFFNAAEVRWLPRSNWLSQPLPIPITHGRTHWGWDGYYAWTDEQTPPTPEHRIFVRRAADMYGPLFQVNFSASVIAKDRLIINMLTDTPGFSYFEVTVNGKQMQVSEHTYEWKLVPGSNNLEICSVDVLGNKGQPSNITLISK